MMHVHVHASCPCSTSMFLSMFSPVHIRSVCVYECVFVCVFVCVCINARMPDCPTSDQSSTEMKIRTKPRQCGVFLVRYQTEILDAGMPMPALVSLMPMPSYAHVYNLALVSVFTKHIFHLSLNTWCSYINHLWAGWKMRILITLRMFYLHEFCDRYIPWTDLKRERVTVD